MSGEPCGHGLHQKYLIRNVGEVCTGCDPFWVDLGPIAAAEVNGRFGVDYPIDFPELDPVTEIAPTPAEIQARAVLDRERP